MGDAAVRSVLTVRTITEEARGIRVFELVDPAGTELPGFTAGAHLDVDVPGATVRQYSLCGDPARRDRYEIAVLDVPGGRGGSRAMHTRVEVGDVLWVSPPRNSFPLHEDAERHLLLAGGIGITPIMAMVERLVRVGARFSVVYCTRSPELTAFRHRLAERAPGLVTVHHDGGDPARALDLRRLLADPGQGTHLYCCGPAGMLAAVATASAHWPAGNVHVERFTAAPPAAPSAALSGGFEVELARTGTVLTVPEDRTILDVLRDAGVERDTSCEAGVCGTCKTRYLAGEPDHQDLVLDDDERAEYLTICCSRAHSPRLVLDL